MKYLLLAYACRLLIGWLLARPLFRPPEETV
jgi:hypothetical protein